ncbi:uncharacterized protein BDZ99DRAFT_570469 [Mytilinidion resinicola]|uniref:Uncharacterized protein n=1 Tax=Mytilinidion resinicola TaxID=574789 RepID=A0A6A6YRT2_9PEZI|nr:uncharacterized protein BDZ99DRAFT_570469 [Mytilinidion resinicola]KAF2811229.1 hypothetical protein BDZ99DRAFT_570469 [Mytilinidion resinicola]
MADGNDAWPPDIDPADPKFQAILRNYLQDAINRYRTRRDQELRAREARNEGTSDGPSDETPNGAPRSYSLSGAPDGPSFSQTPDVMRLHEQLESLRRKMVALIIEKSGLEKTNSLLQEVASERDTVKAMADKLKVDNERLTKEVRQLKTHLKNDPAHFSGIKGMGAEPKQSKSRTVAEEVLPPLQYIITEYKEDLTKEITKRLISLPKPDDRQYSFGAARSASIPSHGSQLSEAPLSDRDVVTFFEDFDNTIERIANMILRYEPTATDKWENFAQYKEMRSLFLRWYIGLKLFEAFFRYEQPTEPPSEQPSEDTSQQPSDQRRRPHMAKITGLDDLVDTLSQNNIDIDEALYPRLAAEYVESVISNGLDEFYTYPAATAPEARNLVKLALTQIAEDACKFAYRVNWNADHGRSRYRYVWLQDNSPFPLERDEAELLGVFNKNERDAEYGWMCFGGVRRQAGAGTGLVSGELEERVLLRKSRVWFWNEPVAQGVGSGDGRIG